MYSADDIIQAARAIEAQLPKLLSQSKAQSLSLALTELLSQAKQGQAVENQILELLTDEPTTRRWLSARLRPSQYDSVGHKHQEDTTRGGTFEALPGMQIPPGIPSPSDNASRYRCPIATCNFSWDRIDVTESIRNCPIHDCQLILSNDVT